LCERQRSIPGLCRVYSLDRYTGLPSRCRREIHWQSAAGTHSSQLAAGSFSSKLAAGSFSS
jgi:hypothetical protein